ncbi:tRNA (N6-threonylcarbamoyladenosine(37)-N6)-methyltransferase TrmO [Psychrobacillus soli]|uniref:tRNA (N6-threonylcarbamoyladenosine(37)-N6)-methyltransferase TrmO n=1 Tax=Psychrobacillus soli TaxID=1543965 RepID=A0A544SKS5_9BACI|nr:tRNA (N6-threonylcarbamoyladenosine(37)-N6)-methyltransferase TrmO [Psychrobacillus soli]TQR05805.1 tRNA (N6-threonylcarbamoyladenosine(37)-N6)-methyltransferase TrmO [Psychrobacillus soli]
MDKFTISSIGTVYNERKTPEDDYWGNVISEIKLNNEWDTSCLDGIESFSHLEILYLFHLVSDDKIQYTSRHPRNNKKYTKVGIFAQRGKNRPNKIGLTVVELIKRKGNTLTVRGLDAIDGTPIIDVKPVMNEFLPKGEVKQPEWATDLMVNYWG